MIKNLFGFLLIAFISQSVAGQDTAFLTKKELTEKAAVQGLQVKLAKAEVESSQADLLQTRAMHLPNVTASYTALTTNNPLMAFGSKLNQSRVTMEDFNPANLNHPNNIGNFGTKLEVQQPLVNMDLVYQKKAAQVKADALVIKSGRTTEYLQMEVTRAYLQLQFIYKSVYALESARKTAYASKKTMDDYYRNGLIQKTDMLYMDIRVAEVEQQLEQAKSSARNASEYIFLLINEDSKNRIIKPADTLAYIRTNTGTIGFINPQRKDILAYSKSLEAYDYLIRSSKAKFFPRINAFGSYEIYDNDPLGFKSGGYLAGLQLSWNIFDGLKAKSERSKYKAEVNRIKTELDLYTAQSQFEMNKAYRDMIISEKKTAVTRLAWEQAKEAYRIRKNRFDQGLEKPSDLLMAESMMAQKELEYYQSVYEYNSATVYYQFLK
ncbi:MAG TPA: TolC family protein [Ferruginibacter sp.]|nr:transporter [Chitinophagaceae bacterium]HRI25986.1 TolC family protein [Ferruginibacter sp.]